MSDSALPPTAAYHFKFLYKAINELVTGPGDIRNRLVYAGQHFLTIPPSVFPEHLRPQAEAIRGYLTEFKAEPYASYPYDTDIRVTMKRRRASTAVRTAEAMWSLYFQYQDAIEADRRERAV